MAISTYKIFLMKKTGNEWNKLIDIKDFPTIFGDPELLDTTTLSDAARTHIAGILSQDSLPFTSNYDKTNFDALKAMEGTEGDYSIWFGGTESGGEVTPTGSDGKFDFTGDLRVSIPGKGVNEVVDMTITLIPSTPVTVPTT